MPGRPAGHRARAGSGAGRSGYPAGRVRASAVRRSRGRGAGGAALPASARRGAARRLHLALDELRTGSATSCSARAARAAPRVRHRRRRQPSPVHLATAATRESPPRTRSCSPPRRCSTASAPDAPSRRRGSTPWRGRRRRAHAARATWSSSAPAIPALGQRGLRPHHDLPLTRSPTSRATSARPASSGITGEHPGRRHGLRPPPRRADHGRRAPTARPALGPLVTTRVRRRRLREEPGDRRGPALQSRLRDARGRVERRRRARRPARSRLRRPTARPGPLADGRGADRRDEQALEQLLRRDAAQAARGRGRHAGHDPARRRRSQSVRPHSSARRVRAEDGSGLIALEPRLAAQRRPAPGGDAARARRPMRSSSRSRRRPRGHRRRPHERDRRRRPLPRRRPAP